jgi:hypothetical protein
MLATNRGSRRSTSRVRPNPPKEPTSGVLALRSTGVATYRPEYALRKVALREPCEGWPAGTVGVVIEPFEDAALVEISGEYGVTLAKIWREVVSRL